MFVIAGYSVWPDDWFVLMVFGLHLDDVWTLALCANDG